jgi:hypothetical protein
MFFMVRVLLFMARVLHSRTGEECHSGENPHSISPPDATSSQHNHMTKKNMRVMKVRVVNFSNG